MNRLCIYLSFDLTHAYEWLCCIIMIVTPLMVRLCCSQPVLDVSLVSASTDVCVNAA